MEHNFPAVEFRNQYHQARVNILQTYSWIKTQVKNILDSFDITTQQFSILLILQEQFPTPISTLDIREKMLDRHSDTSRIVDRMIAKGWVEKTGNTVDRRKVNIILTNTGRDLLNRIAEKNDELDGILDNLSITETEKLNTLLEKIRN